MKTKILLLIASILLISCNSDNLIAQEANTVEYKSIVPDYLINTYINHYGEEVTGNVIITSDRLIIDTSQVYYDLDLKTIPEDQQRLWCSDHIFEIRFTQYEEEILIKITSYLYTKHPYIIISIDNNVLSVFDVYDNTTIPEVPVITPINNN